MFNSTLIDLQTKPGVCQSNVLIFTALAGHLP